MIKLFMKLFFIYSLLLSSISQATLITTDLSSQNYIVYEHAGVSYDVAWASKVNSERWYFGSTFNTLFAPNLHAGWEYASLNAANTNLDIFSSLTGDEVLALFTDTNNDYIQAFEYWNSEFTSSSETADVQDLRIRSEWAITWNEYQINPSYAGYIDSYINNVPGAAFDTFYIRISQVPEPSTLMIFVCGLIALVSKKRLFS